MKRTKKERHKLLMEIIDQNIFVTDEELAKKLQMSIQTIRLDRMELAIPELRKRIKSIATKQVKDVKSLAVEEVIGEIVDLQLGHRAISLFEVRKEHVFSRNNITRGHYLFAQANSLAVAVINDELALTTKSTIEFIRQVKESERVVAKAKVVQQEHLKHRSNVEVNSFVGDELVFYGTFELYHTSSIYNKEGNK